MYAHDEIQDWRQNDVVAAHARYVQESRAIQIERMTALLNARKYREEQERILTELQERVARGAIVAHGIMARAREAHQSALQAEGDAQQASDASLALIDDAKIARIREDVRRVQTETAERFSVLQIGLVEEGQALAQKLLGVIVALAHLSAAVDGVFRGGGHPLDDECLQGPREFAEFRAIPAPIVRRELEWWFERLRTEAERRAGAPSGEPTKKTGGLRGLLRKVS